jgi:hypothetical protein
MILTFPTITAVVDYTPHLTTDKSAIRSTQYYQIFGWRLFHYHNIIISYEIIPNLFNFEISKYSWLLGNLSFARDLTLLSHGYKVYCHQFRVQISWQVIRLIIIFVAHIGRYNVSHIFVYCFEVTYTSTKLMFKISLMRATW